MGEFWAPGAEIWLFKKKKYGPFHWSCSSTYAQCSNFCLFSCRFCLINFIAMGKKMERHFYWSGINSKKCFDIVWGHWNIIQPGMMSTMHFGHNCLTLKWSNLWEWWWGLFLLCHGTTNLTAVMVFSFWALGPGHGVLHAASLTVQNLRRPKIVFISAGDPWMWAGDGLWRSGSLHTSVLADQAEANHTGAVLMTSAWSEDLTLMILI